MELPTSPVMTPPSTVTIRTGVPTAPRAVRTA